MVVCECKDLCALSDYNGAIVVCEFLRKNCQHRFEFFDVFLIYFPLSSEGEDNTNINSFQFSEACQD